MTRGPASRPQSPRFDSFRARGFLRRPSGRKGAVAGADELEDFAGHFLGPVARVAGLTAVFTTVHDPQLARLPQLPSLSLVNWLPNEFRQVS